MGEAMAAGVAKFRQDRQDYNVSVTIHPYRQGRMEDCLHLLDTLAEEVQDRPVRRTAPGRQAGAPGGAADAGGDLQLRHCRRPAAVLRGGRPPRRPVAGDIAAKFLRRDRILLVRRPRLRRTQGPGRRLSGAACGAGAPAGGDCRVAETHDNYDETLAAVTAALAEEPDLKYIYIWPTAPCLRA